MVKYNPEVKCETCGIAKTKNARYWFRAKDKHWCPSCARGAIIADLPAHSKTKHQRRNSP